LNSSANPHTIELQRTHLLFRGSSASGTCRAARASASWSWRS